MSNRERDDVDRGAPPASSSPDSSGVVGEPVPASVVPPGSLPPLTYRNLPEPKRLKQMIGPGVILAGLSLGSGEYVLWPYLTYKSQFVFFWACLLGVTTQYFINMEIARWTLATGESAITGFARLSRHWAWVFLLANLIPHMIPAWGTGAAQLTSWLFWAPAYVAGDDGGGKWISAGADHVWWMSVIGMLLCGTLLTAGPVVYKTIERTQMFLVALVLVLVVVIAGLVIRPDAVLAQIESTVSLGAPHYLPLGEEFGGLDEMMLLGALAFAGCGGTLNLGQSNYVKDKGFGMGQLIGRITSPITGEEESISEIGYHFPHTEENLSRWRRWWSLACWEHFLSFFFTCVFCLVVLTLVSYSLFYTSEGTLRDDVPAFGNNLSFVFGESLILSREVGGYAQVIFLAMGVAILFTTELAVLDSVSRIATDIVKVNWLRNNPKWSEGRLYFLFLWSEITLGILLLYFKREDVAGDTLKNFKIVAAINGGIMGIYSATLLWLNRRHLTGELRIGRFRSGVMIWAILLFGYFGLRALYQGFLKG